MSFGKSLSAYNFSANTKLSLLVASTISAILSLGNSLSVYSFSANAKLSLFVARTIPAIWSLGNSLSAHNFLANTKLSLLVASTIFAILSLGNFLSVHNFSAQQVTLASVVAYNILIISFFGISLSFINILNNCLLVSLILLKYDIPVVLLLYIAFISSIVLQSSFIACNK